MIYAVYKVSTGEIDRQVDCPPSAITQQLGAGEAALIGRVAWGRHYVSGGALMQYTDGQAEVKANPPCAGATWSNATFSWTDPRTLIEHQDAKWAEVKAAREATINAPLITPHGTFDSGPADRTNITDAVLMAQTLAALGQPVSIDFTRADNSTVTLNASQMVEVGLYLGAKVQAAYATSRTLRAAIAAATTINQVQAIHWP